MLSACGGPKREEVARRFQAWFEETPADQRGPFLAASWVRASLVVSSADRRRSTVGRISDACMAAAWRHPCVSVSVGVAEQRPVLRGRLAVEAKGGHY